MAAAVLATPTRAWAWGTVEHQHLGSESYLAACGAIDAELGASGKAPGEVRARFDLVCGGQLAGLALLYGDATAVAGDYVGHPSELFSPAGAWRFQSRKHYWLLALENSSHFNPSSTESWREYHQDALARAVAGAQAQGLRRVDALVQALRESAFADHLLHDSFAAGHMGFNRRASSASAAKSFHDYWNGHGRTVSDVAGNVWLTYGDGKLDDPANADGRRHVLEAATRSVQDVLAAFVFGRSFPEHSLAAWSALPFASEAPALLVDVAGLVEGRATTRETGQVPLAATVKPVRKNTVARAEVWSAGAWSSEPLVAASAMIEIAVPVLPAQTSFGAGGTISQPDGRHAFLGELDLLAPVGLSVDGLISHEVEAGASALFGKSSVVLLHADYRATFELGTMLAFVRGGLFEILPDRRTGWVAGIGLGKTISAAGGGSF